VIDGVGKTTFTKNLDALKPRGWATIFGMASGPADPVVPNSLMLKSLTISGGAILQPFGAAVAPFHPPFTRGNACALSCSQIRGDVFATKPDSSEITRPCGVYRYLSRHHRPLRFRSQGMHERHSLGKSAQSSIGSAHPCMLCLTTPMHLPHPALSPPPQWQRSVCLTMFLPAQFRRLSNPAEPASGLPYR